jgi:hypothetical protein
MHLTKQVQELHNENSKMFTKKWKWMHKKWEDIPYSWIGNISFL